MKIGWVLATVEHIVASKLKDPICHSNECQIGSFISEATIYVVELLNKNNDYNSESETANISKIIDW